MITKPRPRAVLYLRLSQTTETSTSIERQNADLIAEAAASGWDVVRTLADEDLSGGYDRENAETALRMLRDGDADVLAVWKFDRWSRQGLGAVAKLIEVLDERAKSGKPALFVAKSDGLTSAQPAWRIIAAVLAEAARMERENIQFRVRSAIRRNKANGRWTGGTVPLGYASAEHPSGKSSGRILVRATAEANVLEEAARRIVGGESIYATTAWLNTTDVRPRRASSWTLQALSQALTGSAIVGRVVMDGHVIVDDDGLPLEVWTPAIPVDLWHSVRSVIHARRADRPKAAREDAPARKRGRRARLLSGIAVCTCGAPLYVRNGGRIPAKDDKPARPGVALYSCSARSNGRACPGVSVTADRLEEYVTERYLATVGNFEVVMPVEREVAAVELVEAEQALQLVSARLSDLDLEEDLENTLLAQRRVLRARVRVLRSAGASAPVEVELIPTGETYREMWNTTDDVSARRALLSASLDSVEVSKGRRGAHGLDPARVDMRWHLRGAVGDDAVDYSSDVIADDIADYKPGASSNGPSGPVKRRLPRAARLASN